jgi:hypothetical protein
MGNGVTKMFLKIKVDVKQEFIDNLQDNTSAQLIIKSCCIPNLTTLVPEPQTLQP